MKTVFARELQEIENVQKIYSRKGKLNEKKFMHAY